MHAYGGLDRQRPGRSSTTSCLLKRADFHSPSLGTRLGPKVLKVTGLSAFGSLTPVGHGRRRGGDPGSYGESATSLICQPVDLSVSRLTFADFDRVVLVFWTTIVVVGMLSTTGVLRALRVLQSGLYLRPDRRRLRRRAVNRCETAGARHSSDGGRSLGPIIVTFVSSSDCLHRRAYARRRFLC